jgi:hypothetical protein
MRKFIKWFNEPMDPNAAIYPYVVVIFIFMCFIWVGSITVIDSITHVGVNFSNVKGGIVNLLEFIFIIPSIFTFMGFLLVILRRQAVRFFRDFNSLKVKVDEAQTKKDITDLWQEYNRLVEKGAGNPHWSSDVREIKGIMKTKESLLPN